MRAAADAQQRYFLETGSWATRWDDLDMQLPAYKTEYNAPSYPGDYAFLNNGWEIALVSGKIYGIRSVTGRPSITFDLGTGKMICCSNKGDEDPKWRRMCASLGADMSAPFQDAYNRSCYNM